MDAFLRYATPVISACIGRKKNSLRTPKILANSINWPENGVSSPYSGPHVQDSFPPNLSCRADVHRSGLALPQPPRSGR